MKARLSPPISAALAAAACLWALSGCSYVPKFDPYRMEILQGNYVTQDMVSRLQPGMTRDQVRFILGTPLVVDTFRDNRWDYVFSRTPENTRVAEKRRISVFFEDDKLKRVDGDVVPTPQSAPSNPAAGGPPPATGVAGPSAADQAPAAK